MPQHKAHHSVIRLLYDRRGRVDSRTAKVDSASTTSPPSSSPTDSHFVASSASAPPLRIPFPSDTVGHLYYHAHPSAPITATGIRFRVVPDGKRFEEGWDLPADEFERIDGPEGLCATPAGVPTATSLVPWELSLAHAASFPGLWGQLVADGHLIWSLDASPASGNALTLSSIPAISPPSPTGHTPPRTPPPLLPALAHSLLPPTPLWQADRPAGLIRHLDEPFVMWIRPGIRGRMLAAAGKQHAPSDAGEASSNLATSKKHLSSETADREESAAHEDSAVEETDEGMREEDIGEEDAGSYDTERGSPPHRHYVFTPHVSRLLADLTLGKVVAKFEVADDGRSEAGAPPRPVVLCLRVLRELEPVFVPGVWEPSSTSSTSPSNLEGRVLWHVPLDGPLPEATLLNLPRSTYVHSLLDRARASYIGKGHRSPDTETKKKVGRPTKAETEAKSPGGADPKLPGAFPPTTRHAACAPLDVLMLAQQRAALRALALTKTSADLHAWFNGSGSSVTNGVVCDNAPLLAHRMADWIDPATGLVRSVQKPVEVDVDFLGRPNVSSWRRTRELVVAESNEATDGISFPVSPIDPLGLGLASVSMMARRRARAALERRARRQKRLIAMEKNAEKQQSIAPRRAQPAVNTRLARQQLREERAAAWAQKLEEFRTAREERERVKEEAKLERQRRREQKEIREADRMRRKQQGREEKLQLRAQREKEKEEKRRQKALAREERSTREAVMKMRTLEIRRTHLSRASEWLARAEEVLAGAEADVVAAAHAADTRESRTEPAEADLNLDAGAVTTYVPVAVARATILLRQAARHIARARLVSRPRQPSSRGRGRPSRSGNLPRERKARFVVSTLAADKISDIDRVDLREVGQQSRDAFIRWESRQKGLEQVPTDWADERPSTSTLGPKTVVLHHPNWFKSGISFSADTMDSHRRMRSARARHAAGDGSVHDSHRFPAAEGFFYWYEGSDGPAGLRFRLAPSGTSFADGHDWIPEGSHGAPWVLPAANAVRRGRLFPWLRSDNAISPTVETAATLAMHRAWLDAGLYKSPPCIIRHVLPQNLTDADRLRFPGCAAAVVLSGKEYGMPDITFERRRVRAGSTGFLYWDGRAVRFRIAPEGTPFESGRDMRAGFGRWRLLVPQRERAIFAERLVKEGLPEEQRASVLEMASRSMATREAVTTLNPALIGEHDRLDLDGFRELEVRIAGVPSSVPGVVLRWGGKIGRHAHVGARGFPLNTSGFLYLKMQTGGGGIHAEFRFRIVPPGEPFCNGKDLMRDGMPWRFSIRLLCKWQPSTAAALADAGHIPRAYYEEARAAVGLARLGQGMISEADYGEDGLRPLRWRYPSIIRRLSVRRARFRRGPQMRRLLRLKHPRHGVTFERMRISRLDPATLTDEDRVDVRDLRGVLLTMRVGAEEEEGKHVELRLLAPGNVRFPLDAVGFVYWHDPPDRPPWRGALRFRVAPQGTPFADGHDLVHPLTGLPIEWGVSELGRSSPGAVAALAAAGRIPRGVGVHAHTRFARGWARTITNVRDPLIVYFEGKRDIRLLTGDGRAHKLRLFSCFQDARLGGAYPYAGWAVARFEHDAEDANRLRLRVEKLLSPPTARYADYDGYVPPPREGALVMMNKETAWEYVHERMRPFTFPTALDLFWTEATCRADYVRQPGGEAQWQAEGAVQGRRTKGRRRVGR
ncbi:hypothetical protein HDZ31DRAFT_63028 [Schizophyllum fasciatum]